MFISNIEWGSVADWVGGIGSIISGIGSIFATGVSIYLAVDSKRDVKLAFKLYTNSKGDLGICIINRTVKYFVLHFAQQENIQEFSLFPVESRSANYKKCKRINKINSEITILELESQKKYTLELIIEKKSAELYQKRLLRTKKKLDSIELNESQR